MELNRGGLIKLEAYIKRMDNEFAPWLEGFLLQRAGEALEETKQHTPPDFGSVKAGWRLGPSRIAGGSVEVSIVNDDEKASQAEYGYEDQASGQWVEGRFMCTLSIESMLREIPAKFEPEFRRWIKGLEE